jgi:putative membrane protein
MIGFLVRLVINAVALWVATLLVDGVDIGGDTTEDRLLTLALVAAIFGLVNATIKPVVKLLSLPLFILTLGLITFVISAMMLLLTAWVSGQVGLEF